MTGRGGARRDLAVARGGAAGQVAVDPVQVSARSHSPAVPRHSWLAGSNALAGQTVLVPSQLSATSQSPALARHSVPALPAGCVQASPLPLRSEVVPRTPARGSRNVHHPMPENMR